MASRNSHCAARGHGKHLPGNPKNPENSSIFMIFHHFVNLNLKCWFFPTFFQISRIFQISGAVCYQMELSPSWRGVGWANGSCGVVIEACTSRLPCVWGSGDGLEMISGCLRTFFLFFILIFHIRPPNFVNPLCSSYWRPFASVRPLNSNFLTLSAWQCILFLRSSDCFEIQVNL